MARTKLRKVGGSVMVAVPPAILDELDLKPGASVALVVEGQRLIVEPERKPHYTLQQLLAECDADQPLAAEDSEWLDSSPTGRELL